MLTRRTIGKSPRRSPSTWVCAGTFSLPMRKLRTAIRSWIPASRIRQPAASSAPTSLPAEMQVLRPYTGTKYLTTDSKTDMHNFAPRLGYGMEGDQPLRRARGVRSQLLPRRRFGRRQHQYVTDGFSTTANFISPNNGVQSRLSIWMAGSRRTIPTRHSSMPV